MLALTILDLKKFMAAFLGSPMFDSYTLAEAQITTSCTWTVDGRLERAFYGEDASADSGSGGPASPDRVEYICWREVRPRCFDLIRGDRPPLFFKFIFFYPGESLKRFLKRRGLSDREQDISGLCMNLRFDGTRLLLTTGTSLKVFSMDRSVEEAWDDYVRDSLRAAGFQFEQM